jgi:hypothetical protein
MNRIELINILISKYGYQSYLEIGVASKGTYNNVNIGDKTGVDPNTDTCDYKMTSDAFFARNRRKFDIIFIDGLHLWEQVIRDAHDSLEVLNPNGTIMLHDCLPTEENHQLRKSLYEFGNWTGDVWKAVMQLRMNPDLQVCVVDTDWGCGIVRFGHQQTISVPVEIGWDFFVVNKHLMNIVTVDQFLASLFQH